MLKLHHKFIGIDQYGKTYMIKNHPRKELLESLNRQRAEKMYLDDENEMHHVGYIIGGYWITVMRIEPWK